FLEAYQQEQGAPVADQGEVVSTDGKVLSQHGGLYHYTIGQRKGLGVAVGNPLYVISLDPVNRRVVVGDGDALLSRTCFVRDTNWIAVETPSDGLRVEAKIRHQHTPAPATLFPVGQASACQDRHECLSHEGAFVRVEFDAPQRAVTPGQAAVFYQGDLVIGGGWIEGVER
ncbi:MAG: tRNA 2-thiouridine(34) synthase MnmA, partial [Acidobacteria bacterium]|nr:tRNA 2-thiouridine(34) synthase MnmA [Acidobacteriota bacterium]